MKKLTLGTALASLLALTACGDTDTREKHIYTVEVEATESSGKVQTVSKDCIQVGHTCIVSVDLETPNGLKPLNVNVQNGILDSDFEKGMSMLQKVKSKEEEDRLTMPEYDQKLWLSAVDIKGIKYEPKTERWKPRVQRVALREVKMEGDVKLADLKIRIY